MTMQLTHPGAPGHKAEAHEFGWLCSCGAGNAWEDERPRSRGAGGARRHLTAAARNNPEWQAEISAAVADSPETGEDAGDAEDGAPAPMTYAEQLRARQNTAAEFRAP